jgi:hypothetical protein
MAAAAVKTGHDGVLMSPNVLKKKAALRRPKGY